MATTVKQLIEELQKFVKQDKENENLPVEYYNWGEGNEDNPESVDFIRLKDEGFGYKYILLK